VENQPVIETAAPKKNFAPFIIAGVVVLCCCLIVAGAAGVLILRSAPGGVSTLDSYDGIADAELLTDTMNLISAQESSEGCENITLAAGEVVNPPQADLGGVWTEMWQISACGESHLYAVTFSPDPAGGTNIYALRADQ
jgi:hypothetical protein